MSRLLLLDVMLRDPALAGFLKLSMLLVGSYLLGSIPFSYIFPLFKGKNIQEHGTKNVGATNALVVAGPLLGALAYIGDISKGFLAVHLAQTFVGTNWAAALAGLAAIAGHDFSVFLKFKGGKGIATTGGCLFAFDPVFGVIITLFWFLVIVVSRYFIPATLTVLGILPLALWLIGWRFEYIAFAWGAFFLALYTHRLDVVRFISGQETKAPDLVNKYLNQ